MKLKFTTYALLFGAMFALTSCTEESTDDDNDPDEGITTTIAGTIKQINYTSVYDSIDDEDNEYWSIYITYDTKGRISKTETSVFSSYEFGYGGSEPIFGKRKSVYTYTTNKISVQDYESYGDTANDLCGYQEDSKIEYNLNSDGYISSIDDESRVFTYTSDYLTREVDSGQYFDYTWKDGSITSCSCSEDSIDYPMTITYSNVENTANIDINSLDSDTFCFENIFAGDMLGKRSTYLLSGSSRESDWGNGSGYIKTKYEYTVEDGRVTKMLSYYDELDEDESSKEPMLDGIFELIYED